MRHSGGGFCVVQLLAEELTGAPFARLMQDLVLKPLGMLHSTFSNLLPRRSWDNGTAPWAVVGQRHRPPPRLWCRSVGPFVRLPRGRRCWAVDHGCRPWDFRGGRPVRLRGDPGAVLPQEMAKAMMTPQVGGRGLGVGLGGPERNPCFGSCRERPPEIELGGCVARTTHSCQRSNGCVLAQTRAHPWIMIRSRECKRSVMPLCCSRKCTLKPHQLRFLYAAKHELIRPNRFLSIVVIPLA